MVTKRGTPRREIIRGSSGNDLIYGYGGNDDLYGKSGNDVLKGGTGNDRLYGDKGKDRLYGETGNDKLYGGAGKDLIDGGGGNDLLDGGQDADTMKGGAGNDIYLVDNASDTVTDGAGLDEVKTALTAFTLAIGNGVENLTFTGAGPFTGTGNELNNMITGGASGDTLGGGAGDDLLAGGAGADGMSGGSGNDTYVFSAAADVIGDVIIEAASPGGGSDTLKVVNTSAASTDFAFYAATLSNIEIITFETAAGLVTGADLSASQISQPMTVNFGAGRDSVIITADTSADTIIDVSAWTLVNANPADDIFELIGADGSDTVTGSALDDSIYGSAGADTLDGKGGSDTYIFTDPVIAAGSKIQDSGGTGTDQIVVSGTGTSDFSAAAAISGVERLFLSKLATGATFAGSQFGGANLPANLDVSHSSTTGTVAKTITIYSATGFDGSQWTFGTWDPLVDQIIIHGTTGVDTLVGTSQTDIMYASSGSSGDTMDGKGGSDTYILDAYTSNGSHIEDTGIGGTDTIEVSVTQDINVANSTNWAGIEVLKFAGSGTQVRFESSLGSAPANLHVIGDVGDQLIKYNGRNSFDASTWTFTNWIDGVDFVQVIGGGLAGTIIGSTASDKLEGYSQTLIGGPGGDILTGHGTTRISYETAAASLTAHISQPNWNTGDAANDSYVGTFSELIGSNVTGVGDNLGGSSTYAMTIRGLDGNDQLWGGSDADTLDGGAGNDTLVGGSGADSLQGGSGDDAYLYVLPSDVSAGESITDTSGTDAIVVDYIGTFDFRQANVITGIDELLITNPYAGSTTIIFYSSVALSAFPGLQVAGSNASDTLYFAPVSAGSTSSTVDNYSAMQFSNWNAGTDIVKIDGTFGANTITGTSVADHIWGDNGADILTGGLGADRFLYGNQDHSLFATPDVINAFSGISGQGDKLDFTALAGAIGENIVLTSGNGTGAFTGGAVELRWQVASGNVEVLLDLDTDTVADMKIVLTGVGSLDAPSDIILA